jgi:hypothetical protein
MIKAYEMEGHGIYWEVYKWELGKDSDTFINETKTVDEVMEYARQEKQPLTLYTLDWWQTLEEGK